MASRATSDRHEGGSPRPAGTKRSPRHSHGPFVAASTAHYRRGAPRLDGIGDRRGQNGSQSRNPRPGATQRRDDREHTVRSLALDYPYLACGHRRSAHARRTRRESAHESLHFESPRRTSTTDQSQHERQEMPTHTDELPRSQDIDLAHIGAVDRASALSFPASDPPAIFTSHRTTVLPTQRNRGRRADWLPSRRCSDATSAAPCELDRRRHEEAPLPRVEPGHA